MYGSLANAAAKGGSHIPLLGTANHCDTVLVNLSTTEHDSGDPALKRRVHKIQTGLIWAVRQDGVQDVCGLSPLGLD